jgi:SET domain-containing protein
MLAEAGISEEWVQTITTNTADLCPMPEPCYWIEVKPSAIHGKGLFSFLAIGLGDCICPVRLDGKRTPAGRYLNHSPEPNARMILCPDGEIELRAHRFIRAGDEILIDYRESGALQGWTFDRERGRLYKEGQKGAR